MPFFSHNDADIFYDFRGTPDAVVTFINGHTRSCADYEFLAKNLIKEGFSVLVFDNRGSGKTKSTLEFSGETLIADLKALWDHCGITKTHLCGFSMGGYLAQAVTITFPAMIDHLLLLSTAPSDRFVNHDDDSWITDTGTDLDRKLQNFFSHGFVQSHPTYMQMMTGLTRKAIATGKFSERAAAQKDAIFQFPVEDRIDEIKTPTLLVHGTVDKSVWPTASEELHRRIVGSKLVWLDDVAHFSIIERPNEVLAEILKFLPKPKI